MKTERISSALADNVNQLIAVGFVALVIVMLLIITMPFMRAVCRVLTKRN